MVLFASAGVGDWDDACDGHQEQIAISVGNNMIINQLGRLSRRGEIPAMRHILSVKRLFPVAFIVN